MKRTIRSQAGMTLIEIMIVLIIIGGLAAILGQRVIGQLGTANRRQAIIQIKEIGKQVDMFYADCGFYPSTDQGLKALTEAPGDCQNWGPEPYMKNVPKDPWKHDYIYEQKSKSSYTLISLGADGVEGGKGNDEDISSENI
jgi:general secretion pathway protein G